MPVLARTSTTEWGADLETFSDIPKDDSCTTTTTRKHQLKLNRISSAPTYRGASSNTKLEDSIDDSAKSHSSRMDGSAKSHSRMDCSAKSLNALHGDNNKQQRRQQRRHRRTRRTRSHSPVRESSGENKLCQDIRNKYMISGSVVDLNLNNDESERDDLVNSNHSTRKLKRKCNSTVDFGNKDWQRQSITERTAATENCSDFEMSGDFVYNADDHVSDDDDDDDFSACFHPSYNNYNNAIQNRKSTNTTHALQRLKTIELHRTGSYIDENDPALERMRRASYRGMWDEHTSTVEGEDPKDDGYGLIEKVDYFQNLFQEATDNMGKTADVLAEEPTLDVLNAIVDSKLDCLARNIETIGSWFYSN